MLTKSLATKRRSRCTIVQGLIPSNNHPLSHRLVRGSSSRVGSARVSVASPGVVQETPMEAAGSINRNTRGRAPSRIRITSRGAASSKVTLASSKKPGIPTTGQLTARNTRHTQVAARVPGRNTWMSSSGNGRRS
jgi:hypothetical protein